MVKLILKFWLQAQVNTNEIDRTREDKYRVSWVTGSSGKLSCLNKSSKCEDADFIIS